MIVISSPSCASRGTTQSQGLRGGGRFEPDVKRPRRPAADPDAAAAADDSVIGRPLGHGEVERNIGEHPRHKRRPRVVAEPRADHLDDPPADDFGRERSAIEEDRVGPRGPIRRLMAVGRDRLGSMPAQEKAQMPGNGRIGDERQAELLQAALGGPRGIFVRGDAREETVERDRLDLGARQLRLDAAADQLRAAAGDRDRPALEGPAAARPAAFPWLSGRRTGAHSTARRRAAAPPSFFST